MFNLKLTLLKNKPYADGSYPVMIRVGKKFEKGKTYIATGFTSTEKQFDSKTSRFRRSYPDYQRANAKIQDKLNKAYQLAEGLAASHPYCSIQEFKDRYQTGSFKFDYNLFEYIEKRISEYNKYNTRLKYQSLLSSLKAFDPTKNKFEDYTPEMLEKYARWAMTFGMTKPNKSNSIWMRLTCLRSIYNHARKNGYCPKELYPFDYFNVAKFHTETVKRALTIDQIKKIWEFDVSDRPELIHAKYFFMFSYLAWGMNYNDMAKLTWSENVIDNHIHYYRSKTKKLFKIGISPRLKEILDYYRQTFVITDYIFPVYDGTEETEKDQKNAMSRRMMGVKKGLKEITSATGLPTEMTMYWARHSFATHLDRANVNPNTIRDVLGHKNLATTQIYLSGLSTDEINQVVTDNIF